MKSDVNVVYRDFDASVALNSIIDKKLQKLSKYTDDITHSRVVLDMPHNHKHKGKQFRASIELSIKGAPVTISQDDASIHVAVREAFNAAERKLKNLAGRKRAGRTTTPNLDIENEIDDLEEGNVEEFDS